MGIRNFHWDDVNDCVLEETDGSGATLVAYTYEPGSYGPLLSEFRSSTTSTHHYDALVSTQFLTDDSGTATDSYTFDAWGNVLANTGSTPTPYQWIGRWSYQCDNSPKRYYIRERSYVPTIAKWSSVDLLLFTDGTNGFGYVFNRPTASIDPSGFFTVTYNGGFQKQQIDGPCPEIPFKRNFGNRTTTLKLEDNEIASLTKAKDLVFAATGDILTLGFSQRVTRDVELSTRPGHTLNDGACFNVNGELDTKNCGCLQPCTIKYSWTFVEMLQDGARDGNAFIADDAAWKVLQRACPDCFPSSPCCACNFKMQVTKSLTPSLLWPFVNLQQRVRHRFEHGEATVVCGGITSTFKLGLGDQPDPGYPAGPEDPNAIYPTAWLRNQQYQRSQRLFEIDHPQCQDAVPTGTNPKFAIFNGP